MNKLIKKDSKDVAVQQYIVASELPILAAVAPDYAATLTGTPVSPSATIRQRATELPAAPLAIESVTVTVIDALVIALESVTAINDGILAAQLYAKLIATKC